MKNVLMLLCAVTLVFGMMGRASAVTIFSDDFNRSDSNSVDNGWQEIEKDANDVAIVSNTAQLRDTQTGIDAAIMQPIDLTGRNSIGLSFDYISGDTEESDTLSALYDLSDGNWIAFFTTGLGNPGVLNNVTLDLITQGVYVENEPAFRLRFDIAVSAAGEFVKLDNVLLFGEVTEQNYVPPSPIPNPEPTTLLLMGVGIVGLIGGVARKRLNKKAIDKS